MANAFRCSKSDEFVCVSRRNARLNASCVRPIEACSLQRMKKSRNDARKMPARKALHDTDRPTIVRKVCKKALWVSRLIVMICTTTGSSSIVEIQTFFAPADWLVRCPTLSKNCVLNAAAYGGAAAVAASGNQIFVTLQVIMLLSALT